MSSTARTRRRRRSTYNPLPHWLSVRRLVAASAALLVVIGGVYGTRLVLSLSGLFHESPAQVIGDLIGGKGSSSVGRSVADLRRINIALYGYGGLGHDGAFLTDSIMVVSIQPRADGKPPQVAEISIPRDLYLPIDLGGGRYQWGRVNEAYSSGTGNGPMSSTTYTGDRGGGALADHELEQVLGIHIDHFVGVDFTAFKDVVDTVGGIDVNVPHTFTDYQYPRGECSGPHPDCSYMTVHFNAGVQHMDGAQALEFSRSRHSADNGEGSDFARSRRQQLVLAAVRQKVLSIGGIGNLPDVLNALGNHVVTDLQVSDVTALYDLVKGVENGAIEHISIDDQNFLYECGYPRACSAAYLYPHDPSFSSLQHFVQNVFPAPAAATEKAPVTVVDGSGQGLGASGRWASLLGAMGLSVTDGGVHRYNTGTHVIDMSGGRDLKTAQWLASFFGVQVESEAAGTGGATAGASGSASPSAGAGGVLVVLGADEERSFSPPGRAYGYGPPPWF